jgi:hypothetical protein
VRARDSERRAVGGDQLEAALRADDADEKDVCVREALQLVRLADETSPTDGEVSGPVAPEP